MFQGIRQPTPEQAAAAMEVGNHLTMEIVKRKKKGRLEIQFNKINPADDFDMSSTLDLLANQFALGFSKNFGVKCKIIDVV